MACSNAATKSSFKDLPTPAYSEFPPFESEGVLAKFKKLMHLGPTAHQVDAPSELPSAGGGLILPSLSINGGRRSTGQDEAERMLDDAAFAKSREIEDLAMEQPTLDLQVPAQRKYGHARKGSRRGASISLAKDVVRNGCFM